MSTDRSFGPLDDQKRRRILPFFIAAVVVIFMALTSVSGFVTDRMWFDSLGQTTVFDTVLLTKIELFFLVGGLSALVVGLNVFIAFRSRPTYMPRNTLSDIPGLDQVDALVTAIRRFGLIGGPLLIGVLFGIGGSESWQSWLAYRNAQPFGQTDATFGLDLSYFIFQLP